MRGETAGLVCCCQSWALGICRMSYMFGGWMEMAEMAWDWIRVCHAADAV